MSEEKELREKLNNYSIQLQKVEDLIEKDPENEDWKKLQNDLRAAGKALKGLPLMYLASSQ